MNSKYLIGKVVTALLMWLLTCQYALATYQVYFMNNTHQAIKIVDDCSAFLSGACQDKNPQGSLKAYQRKQTFTINYDEKIKHGKSYVAKTVINFSDHTVAVISATVKGDLIGSHLTQVSFAVNGENYTLLDDKNSSHKVLPDRLVGHTFTTAKGNTYTLYVDAQKDHDTTQGIDSLYFTLHEKHAVLKPRAIASQLGMITYNIQAFPNYIGIALDLNKMNSRVNYLVHSDYLKNTDVVMFEEAWDHDIRKVIINGLKSIYPYFVDPVPENDHLKPLNSGLLVLSRYPITRHAFIDYQDYQTLVSWDNYSNKGALYFKVNKLGQDYNIIVTHVQAGGDSAKVNAQALKLRRQEFLLIKEHLIDGLGLSKEQPLIIAGDLNTDYYDKSDYGFLQKTLNLGRMGMTNSVYAEPLYSSDDELNLMKERTTSGGSVLDYISPVLGFKQPFSVKRQITPVRAVDSNRMYQRSKDIKIYHYGNIETSDHFMVQSVFYY